LAFLQEGFQYTAIHFSPTYPEQEQRHCSAILCCGAFRRHHTLEKQQHSNFSFQIHYIYKKWLIISKNLDLRAYKQDFKLNLLPFYYY